MIFPDIHTDVENNINIEDMETSTSNAPVSGTILFTMDARVSCDESTDEDKLFNNLYSLGEKLGVDITISRLSN